MHQTDPTPQQEIGRMERIIREIFPFDAILSSLNDLRELELDRFFEMVHVALEREGCECELHISDIFHEETYEVSENLFLTIITSKSDNSKFAFECDTSSGFRVVDYAIPQPRDGLGPTRPDMLIVR